MRRRAFTLGLGGAAFSAFAPAAAQSSESALIAYVGAGFGNHALLRAFRDGMRELGHVEGRTYRFEERYAEGDPARLPALVGELVARHAAVFLTGGTNGARAILQRAPATPIVVMQIVDIAELEGTIASLARPGGSVTGLAAISRELHAKQLELLREFLPALKTVAVLWDPRSRPDHVSLKVVEAAAKTLGVAMLPVEMTAIDRLGPLLQSLRERGAEALLVIRNFRTQSQHLQVVAAVNAARLPAVYETRVSAEAGGLLSYGASFADLYRRSASYVDRILKGAKPGDLPIEQPSKFELVINLKAAKALGIEISPALIVRADEVIE